MLQHVGGIRTQPAGLVLSLLVIVGSHMFMASMVEIASTPWVWTGRAQCPSSVSVLWDPATCLLHSAQLQGEAASSSPYFRMLHLLGLGNWPRIALLTLCTS